MLFKRNYIIDGVVFYRHKIVKKDICDGYKFDISNSCSDDLNKKCCIVSEIFFDKVYRRIRDNQEMLDYCPYDPKEEPSS